MVCLGIIILWTFSRLLARHHSSVMTKYTKWVGRYNNTKIFFQRFNTTMRHLRQIFAPYISAHLRSLRLTLIPCCIFVPWLKSSCVNSYVEGIFFTAWTLRAAWLRDFLFCVSLRVTYDIAFSRHFYCLSLILVRVPGLLERSSFSYRSFLGNLFIVWWRIDYSTWASRKSWVVQLMCHLWWNFE